MSLVSGDGYLYSWVKNEVVLCRTERLIIRMAFQIPSVSIDVF